VLAAVSWVAWKLFIVKKWVEDVEYEGNVDANKALEDLNDDEEEQEDAKKEAEKEKEKKEEGTKKGKGKKK
jgi:hypothetical protein